MTLGYNNDHIFYLEEFSASPFDTLLVPVAKQQLKQHGIPTSAAELQRKAEQEAKQQLQQRGIPTSTRQLQRQAERQVKREVTKLVGPQVEQLKQQVLKNMKLPVNIPFPIPTDLSPEGVKNAAINAGADYLEKQIQQQTGIPIPVPRSLSAKEIERSITGVLPSDAAEAIDLAVNIGIQYASGAIASAIAGAAIGSAVPGLGTVIGIGMALGYEALKSALVEKPTVQPCRANFPVGVRVGPATQVLRQCPPFPQVSPVEMLPWLAQNVAPMQYKLNQMDKGLCYGPLQQCASVLMTVSAEIYNASKTTPQVMDLYSVSRIIPQYEAALQLPRSRATQDMGLLLPAMRKRRDQLNTLVAKINQIATLSARDVASLRFTLVTELGNAARQFAFNQNADTRRWLSTLGQAMQRLVQREKSLTAERVVRKKQQKQRFEKRRTIPAEQKKHVLQQLQFQCGQDNAAACKEYKRIAAGGQLTAQQLKQFGITPSAPTPPRAPATGVSEAQARKIGEAMLSAWLRDNPGKRGCMTPQMRERLLAIFVAAHARKTIPIPRATQSIMAILSQC